MRYNLSTDGVRRFETVPDAPVIACAPGRRLASMAAGVYFGGHGQLPLAMVGTALFVRSGGLTFELARRRSL